MQPFGICDVLGFIFIASRTSGKNYHFCINCTDTEKVERKIASAVAQALDSGVCAFLRFIFFRAMYFVWDDGRMGAWHDKTKTTPSRMKSAFLAKRVNRNHTVTRSRVDKITKIENKTNSKQWMNAKAARSSRATTMAMSTVILFVCVSAHCSLLQTIALIYKTYI